MKQFIPIDFHDEESEFVHFNPDVVVHIGIVPTVGGDNFVKTYPFTVEAYLINHEEVSYQFKTKEEAKGFIRKVGGLE